MIQIKEFKKQIESRITIWNLTCNVIIDGQEHKVSAVVNQDNEDIELKWSSDVQHIDTLILEELELDMLDKLYF